MDVFVNGKQKVVLSTADFLGQGGQGSVYAKDAVAYKIYTDPAAMPPAAKLIELGGLVHPGVIAPQDILFDRNRRPVGYTMPFAAGTTPLCRTFNRAFREREAITPDRMLALVRAMQETIGYIHQRGVLIVDLNETNFLTDFAYRQVIFIDVDSYQTSTYPALAIMETVRDRHATFFSEVTDWFSFAVVSFQMFVGIHPYKGHHRSLKGLDERMEANISALSPDVSLPAACLPFSVIPQAYLDWYHAVLDRGARIPPPSGLRDAIMLTAMPLPGRSPNTDALIVDELCQCPAAIIAVVEGLIVTTAGIVAGAGLVQVNGARMAITRESHKPIACRLTSARVSGGGNRAEFFDVNQAVPIQSAIAAEQLMTTAGRAYIMNAGRVYEIDFLEIGGRIVSTATPIANTLSNGAQLFEGVLLQNLLDACYVSIFPNAGTCRQLRIDELRGRRLIDARYESGVLVVITEAAGRYDRLIFRIDGTTYDVRRHEDIPTPSLNFTVLSTGVCLLLNDADELEVFNNRPASAGMKVVRDAAVDGACKLFHNGAQAQFARGDRLYKFAMNRSQVVK